MSSIRAISTYIIHTLFPYLTHVAFIIIDYVSVQPPLDLFTVYIDGEDAAQLVNVQEFTEVALGLSEGPHTIDFSYQFNPVNLPVLSPSPPER